MKLDVYTGHTQFNLSGLMRTNDGIITFVDISTTIPRHDIPPIEWKRMDGKLQKPVQDIKFEGETDYKFDIRKLSKGDFANRNSGLTHEIVCESLTEQMLDIKFYTRLSYGQAFKLNKSLKKLFWQTQDFKSHMYKYLATNALTAIISILGTLSVLKTCNKKDTTSTQLEPSLSSDTLIHQTIRKTDRFENAPSVPYSIDTTKTN